MNYLCIYDSYPDTQHTLWYKWISRHYPESHEIALQITAALKESISAWWQHFWLWTEISMIVYRDLNNVNSSNQHCHSMVKSDHVLSCKNFATALSTVVYNQCSIVWYYSSIAQQIHIPNIRFTYSLTNQELELLAQARKKARHTLIRNYSIVCSLINSMHNFSNQIPNCRNKFHISVESLSCNPLR